MQEEKGIDSYYIFKTYSAKNFNMLLREAVEIVRIEE
jgi:hypothetical protein